MTVLKILHKQIKNILPIQPIPPSITRSFFFFLNFVKMLTIEEIRALSKVNPEFEPVSFSSSFQILDRRWFRCLHMIRTTNNRPD